jgi:hypothetical protein
MVQRRACLYRYGNDKPVLKNHRGYKMKKKNLTGTKEKEEAAENKGPLMIYFSDIRKITDLEELVKEHGTVYISVKGGLPLKVTQAELK